MIITSGRICWQEWQVDGRRAGEEGEERRERSVAEKRARAEQIRSVRKALAPGEIGRPGEEVSRRQRYPPAARFRLHRAPTTSHKIYFICHVFAPTATATTPTTRRSFIIILFYFIKS